MKNVQNDKLKKELKRLTSPWIAIVVLFTIGVLCLVISFYNKNQVTKKATFLNDLLEKDSLEENVNSYLEIKGIDFYIGKYEKENYGYYVVYDDTYNYIVRLSTSEYEKLKDQDLQKNPVKLYGKTKKVSSNVKNSVINLANDSVKVSNKPIYITEYSSEPTNAFYIVDDGEIFYIAYLSDADYKKLNTDSISKKPITIKGATKNIPPELKKQVIELFNQTDFKIKEEEFEKYFGSYYIDTTATLITTNNFESFYGGLYLDTAGTNTLSNILFVLGIIFFAITFWIVVIYLFKRIRVNKRLKKLDDGELEKIEEEIDSKDSFYYEKIHVILTKNYLIDTYSKLTILKYEDLIWMYEHKLRQYGFTTLKNLVLLDKKNKAHSVAIISGMTRKSQEILDEIADTIATKNKNILIGYTKENRLAAKERIEK